MRYWGFLGIKLSAAVTIAWGLMCAVFALWPDPPHYLAWPPPTFGYNLPYTFAIGLCLLAGYGLIHLAILDQRYRCRVCLRRLRMPVPGGSWSRMLQLGRPRTEYICPFGHGSLDVSEVQFTGLENPQWKQHGDWWTELLAASKDDKA